MVLPLQFEAPTALAYFASLVADDAGFPLLEAAIAIGQDDRPSLDTLAVLSQIDALAERLKRRVPADAVPVQRLRWLNHFFFHELGFAGNVNDYYDPRNSYLDAVLDTRRGIPITLSVLYMELATQIGLTARGVSFPGHFLVKVKMPQGEVVIDPFTGHSLGREELDELLAPYRKRQGLEGDFEMPLGLFLQPSTPREVLSRMLRNLKEIHRSARDLSRQLAVSQRLVILLPLEWQERRDRGLVYAELGLADAAALDLSDYLEHVPEAMDRAVIAERLKSLRKPGPAPLH